MIFSRGKKQSKINENPWPIYKIKLGVKNDLEIVKALRNVTNSVFRIDANCAWGTEETIEKTSKISEFFVVKLCYLALNICRQ